MTQLILLSIGIAALIGIPGAILMMMLGRVVKKSLPSFPAPTNGVSVPAAATKDGLPFVDESIEDVGKSTHDYLRRHPWYIAAPLLATVVVELFFVLIRVDGLDLYAAPITFIFIGYSLARNRIQHEFMRQFALSNGFTYGATGSLDGLDGSLFQIGRSRSVADVVSGQFQSRPISLFSYSYVTGYGKSQQTHNYTIYELQFDTLLPDLMLENGGHTFGESLSAKLSGKELLKLEGDFNKYFSLSIPKGFETEALEIFTPDVMEALIEKAKALSLEIVNNHLFIYDNVIVGTKQGLYDLYLLAQFFIEKLGPRLARMKSSALAMEQYQK